VLGAPGVPRPVVLDRRGRFEWGQRGGGQLPVP
jgi:hypothetical protein